MGDRVADLKRKLAIAGKISGCAFALSDQFERIIVWIIKFIKNLNYIFRAFSIFWNSNSRLQTPYTKVTLLS
jgi:hypothetical protein